MFTKLDVNFLTKPEIVTDLLRRPKSKIFDSSLIHLRVKLNLLLPKDF